MSKKLEIHEALEIITNTVYYAVIESNKDISPEGKKIILDAYQVVNNFITDIQGINCLDLIIRKRVNIELLAKCKDAAGYNQSIQHLPACAFLRTEEFKAIKSLL